jgi:hypothetical protein
MADIRHYLNGKLVNPRNFENAKVVIDWIGQKEAAKITIDSIELVGQEGKELRDRILSGLSGGVGFFEGEPYQIQIGDFNNPKGTFDGFLDFSDGVEFIDECDVNVKLKREQGSDWLTEVAEGFSYRFLFSEGVISESDFFAVPYVINYIPDGVELIILSLSAYVLTKELIENIKALGNTIADIQDAATPVIGASVGFGAGAVTAYDIGNIILTVLKAIVQVAYIVAIVVAIVELVEQIIEQLMPPKRFHKGIPVRLLFQRACDYLNLKLSSSLLDSIDTGSNKWVLIPSKGHRGGEKPTGAGSDWRETGVPSQNDPTDTFAGVIRIFKQMFNADYQIKDGTFIFERKDFFRNQSNYIIPDTFIEQEKLIDVNTFNTDEFVSNYVISYSFDVQDQNTLDNQQGRVFQAQIVPKTTINANLKNYKGLENIGIPFSMPVRKNELTAIEIAVRDLVSIADGLTGQLGNPQSLSGQINNRIGTMHLSSHFLTIPKIVVMSGSQLQFNQRQILDTFELWNNFHFINSFKQINGFHNQYYLYKQQKIPFCFSDFLSLLDNNKVTTQSGENAEIESVEWNVWEDFAVIDYRINKLYDDNFRIIYL